MKMYACRKENVQKIWKDHIKEKLVTTVIIIYLFFTDGYS